MEQNPKMGDTVGRVHSVGGFPAGQSAELRLNLEIALRVPMPRFGTRIGTGGPPPELLDGLRDALDAAYGDSLRVVGLRQKGSRK